MIHHTLKLDYMYVNDLQKAHLDFVCAFSVSLLVIMGLPGWEAPCGQDVEWMVVHFRSGRTESAPLWLMQKCFGSYPFLLLVAPLRPSYSEIVAGFQA